MKKVIGILVLVVVLAFGGLFAYRQYAGVKKVAVDSSAQGARIEEFSNADAFITPFQLEELMASEEDVVVIGALNPTAGNEPIEGSFTMWRSDYSAAEGVYPFGGMANTADEMAALLSSFGVNDDTLVVVYASNSHHDAARLFYQIHYVVGHKQVRYLDGGLNAWTGATGDANPTVEASGYEAKNPKNTYTADLDMVKEAIENPDEWLIIDTRTAGEESGESTKSGAFGPGKIPGALWIEWTNAVGEDTTLKAKADLEVIYEAALDGKKVITFCQSGVRSAHTQVVLKEVLGVEETYNYDGSWIEWSYEYYENGATVTVENGE